jgi:hypothetical protein
MLDVPDLDGGTPGSTPINREQPPINSEQDIASAGIASGLTDQPIGSSPNRFNRRERKEHKDFNR